MTTIRLGDLLLRAGVVTQHQLNEALAEQQRWGGKLGSILVRTGVLPEDLLVKALSRQLGIPSADLRELRVPDSILQRIDRNLCEQHLVLPIAYIQQRRSLAVAVADPTNVVFLDDLSRRVGLRIETLLAGEKAILEGIQRLFGESVDTSVSGDEPGMKLVNNHGTTLIKTRDQIVAEHRARSQANQTAAAPSSMPAPAAPAPVTTGGALVRPEHVQMIEKQAKAVRAICELLIDKGVMTRDEFISWMHRQG